MERRNETLIKLAQTGLMAALCFVTFSLFQIKIPMPGGGATGYTGSGIYHRSAKDVCTEVLYRPDHGFDRSQDCEDQ